ncbi:MAG: hypothetical protein KGJ02_05995 [Verrucomicrobiota bacterium]|nr:hypothetical protein [Verrucomicrobiota bacterium]
MFLLTLLLVGCTKNTLPTEIADSNVIEYPAQDDQYTIVIVQDKISDSVARKMARQKAAEITVKEGNRYFVMVSEQKIQVVRPDAPRAPGNMYQELIMQDSFGQESLGQDVGPNGAVFPGLRVVFQTYEDKPEGQDWIDACKYTKCK